MSSPLSLSGRVEGDTWGRSVEECRSSVVVGEEALEICHRLAASSAYEPDVATTLNNLNLGTVLGDLGEREVARAAFEEALRLYQPFLSDGPKRLGKVSSFFCATTPTWSRKPNKILGGNFGGNGRPARKTSERLQNFPSGCHRRGLFQFNCNCCGHPVKKERRPNEAEQGAMDRERVVMSTCAPAHGVSQPAPSAPGSHDIGAALAFREETI